jgi:hypothetical protein
MFGVCYVPLHEECPKHHGHKGDPKVIPSTCGNNGEKAQIFLIDRDTKCLLIVG